jgi:hypothetical protein
MENMTDAVSNQLKLVHKEPVSILLFITYT